MTQNPEPSSTATDYVGITTRINWLISNVEGIDAQLAERGDTAEAAWRARAIAAKHYRLVELRSQKLRRHQLAAPDDRSPELLRRAAAMLTSWDLDRDSLDDDEFALLGEIKEYLR